MVRVEGVMEVRGSAYTCVQRGRRGGGGGGKEGRSFVPWLVPSLAKPLPPPPWG